MSREEWIYKRNSLDGIGCSDIATALDLNPFKSAFDLAYKKLNNIAEPENSAMKAGRIQEAVIAMRFQDDMERRVRKDNKIRLHPDFDFIFGDIDRIIMPTKTDDRGVLECKNTTSLFYRQYQNTELGVPEWWYVQLQCYLSFGFKFGFVAAQVDGRDMDYNRFEYDQELIDIIVPQIKAFLNNLKNGIMPEPRKLDDIKRAFPKSVTKKTMEASELLAEKVKAYDETKAKIKILEGARDDLEIQIKAEMGDAEILSSNGEIIKTWKSSAEYFKFNEKEFKEYYPELHDKFKTTKVSPRPFK